MIYYDRENAAAYVCNHKGSAPTADDQTGLFPSQQEVDTLIGDINRNKNLIACVAMEYSKHGYRKPDSLTAFTKFFIFGADGGLWSTVDLDGRGPKGVPNVCTACHGGKFDYENAGGQFDSTLTPKLKVDGTLREPGDLVAHFLPFDIANFAFSSKLTPEEQEPAIFELNLDVFNIERDRWHVGNNGFVDDGLGSLSIQNLITGWYGDSALANPPAVAPHLNRNYVPPRWDADFIHHDAYVNVHSHSCRTCHVAMDRAAGEDDPNVFASVAKQLACDLPASIFATNQHVMPNAKVTFDRFWLSRDFVAPVPQSSLIDQPSYLAKLIANPLPAQPPLTNNPAVTCDKPNPESH